MRLELNDKIIILERQLLHALIDDNNLNFDKTLFDDVSLSIYESVKNCKKDTKIIENLASESNVSLEILNSVYDTKYSKDSINDYIKELTAKKIIYKTIENINNNVECSIDIDKINELKNALENVSNNLKKDDEKNYQSWKELLNEHLTVLKDRQNGIYYPIGMNELDKILPKVTAGIISIVGYSGSTKSTFISHLILSRLRQHYPTIYFNTELSKEAVLDGFCSELLRIPYNEVCGYVDNEESIDSLISLLKTEINNKYEHKFAMWKNANASVKDIETLAIECRKNWKLNNDIPIYCVCDLLSMFKEFNNTNNKASSYEDALNELNAICLNNNIVCVGTFQLKRSENACHINQLDDLGKYEPRIEAIKNSNAIQERSRIVLSIFNRKHVLLASPHNEILEEICSPAIEIKVLKNSFGEVGKKCKYKFNSTFKCYDKWTDEDEELWSEKIEDTCEDDSPQDINGNWKTSGGVPEYCGEIGKF